MSLLVDLFSRIAAAAVGALLQGWMKFRSGRRPETELKAAVSEPVQSVVAVADGALVEFRFPINSVIRDILEIPREKSAVTPPLIVPGEGIVSPNIFVDHAMDALVARADVAMLCLGCRKLRRVGAMMNSGWYCQKCLEPQLTGYANGNPEQLAQTTFKVESWPHVKPMLTSSIGMSLISSEPIIQSLQAAIATHHSLGAFQSLWLEQNVVDNKGVNSLRIHMSFEVHALQQSAIQVLVYFQKADGTELMHDGKVRSGYVASNGQVCAAGNKIGVCNHFAKFEDYHLIIPYDEFPFHAGAHKIACVPALYSYGLRRILFRGERKFFYIFYEGKWFSRKTCWGTGQ
jgi:hypothetical protein